MNQLELKKWINYDKDTGVFTRAKIKDRDYKNKVGDIVANNLRSGYLRINIEGKAYSAHRLAWLYEYGVFPSQTIDHKDRNKLNNRIDNLRDVSSSINKINQDINIRNKSGTVGVHFCKKANKWVANITPSGKKRIVIGSFADKDDAIIARIEAETKFF